MRADVSLGVTIQDLILVQYFKNILLPRFGIQTVQMHCTANKCKLAVKLTTSIKFDVFFTTVKRVEHSKESSSILHHLACLLSHWNS